MPTGKIQEVRDQLFGFIVSDVGGCRLFFHRRDSEFDSMKFAERTIVDVPVEFEIVKRDGKTRAINVRPVGD